MQYKEWFVFIMVYKFKATIRHQKFVDYKLTIINKIKISIKSWGKYIKKVATMSDLIFENLRLFWDLIA
jgi:hypothetical protein